MKLYLTDYNPNGTNDLIIENNGIVVEVIDEACFGFRGEFNAVMDENSEIFETLDTDVQGMTPLIKASWSDVLDRLACNPIDPEGLRKLSQIKSALRRVILVKGAA